MPRHKVIYVSELDVEIQIFISAMIPDNQAEIKH